MENPTIKLEPSEGKVGLDNVLSTQPVNMSPRRRGWFVRILSIGARVFIWSCVFIMLFRCPSSVSELSNTSSYICKPYLEARHRITPYIQPYYDEYAAHYVDLARPHADTLQKAIYLPVKMYAKKSYDQYAAPRVDMAQKQAQKEWDKTVRPRLDDAKAIVRHQYDESVAPIVHQAIQLSQPYIEQARSAAIHQYYSNAIPAYEKSLPYVQRTYQQGLRLTTEIIFPYARYGTDLIFHFLTRNLWPRLSILYGENVEPQLVKIRERLANYRDAKNIEAAVEDLDQNVQITGSAASSDVSSTIRSGSSTLLRTDKTSETSTDSSHSVTNDRITTTGSSAASEETERQISEDLKIWQEKFRRAADRGADDLEERVAKITTQQIDHQAHVVGDALLIQLEESVSSALERIKSDTKKATEKLPEDASEQDLQATIGFLRDSIKLVGKSIKEKAQSVRTWKAKYDSETATQIRFAKDSTLDVIDNIRDLGLQEIGMRWASMDGVTYKDWSEYHTLKKTFDEWRITVESVAVNHASVAKAKAEGDDIEAKAMAIAEDAAIELARLKDVVAWKVDARDSSDDFNNKILPARALKAGKKILDNMSSAGAALMGSTNTQGPVDSVWSKASGDVTEIVSSAASIVAGILPSQNTPLSSSSSSVSVGIAAASSSASSMSSIVVHTVEEVFSSTSSTGTTASSSASPILDHGAGSGPSNSASELHDGIRGSKDANPENFISKVGKVIENVVPQATERATDVSGIVDSEIPVVHDLTSSTASDVKASVSIEFVSESQSALSAAKEKIKSATEAVRGSPPPGTDYVSSASEDAAQYASVATDSVSSAAAQVSIDTKTTKSVLSTSVSSESLTAIEFESLKEAWSRSIESMVSSKKAASSSGTAAAEQSSTTAQGNDVSSEDPEMVSSWNIHEAIKKAGDQAAALTASLLAEQGSDAAEETDIPNWTIEL